jgi:hypothetical protein
MVGMDSRRDPRSGQCRASRCAACERNHEAQRPRVSQRHRPATSRAPSRPPSRVRRSPRGTLLPSPSQSRQGEPQRPESVAPRIGKAAIGSSCVMASRPRSSRVAMYPTRLLRSGRYLRAPIGCGSVCRARRFSTALGRTNARASYAARPSRGRPRTFGRIWEREAARSSRGGCAHLTITRDPERRQPCEPSGSHAPAPSVLPTSYAARRLGLADHPSRASCVAPGPSDQVLPWLDGRRPSLLGSPRSNRDR